MKAKTKDEGYQTYTDDPMPEIPMTMSEGLLRRDNYFHACWMELKHRRADLMAEMSEVELLISGYSLKDNSDDTDNRKDTEIL